MSSRRPALRTAPARLQSLPQRTTSVQPNSWRAGKTSGERGYDYRWQQARKAYLEHHPLCVKCTPIVTVATVVDHIVPHHGDQVLFWDETNWQSLCKPHHDSDKAREERGLR